MKTIKQIGLVIGLSIIMMVLMSAFMFITTGSIPVFEIMIAYAIIDIYAICRGWHKIMWKSMIERKPLTDEEADFF